ncbi:TatD family deoxyribonuclease [bacterium]|nr:MAG: TatD family deoxyribonuclease [bacterium]
MLVDTHCHLDFPAFDQDRDEVIKRAKEHGVGYIVNIGSSLLGSTKSLELSAANACIYATVGIHPHEADSFNQEMRIALEGLAKKEKVVAIGEIGLDYFRNYSQAENQRKLFLSLLQLARELNLPVVVHSRQASADTLKTLKKVMPVKAVLHCFSGDNDFLQACLDLGFSVSFTCNLTYNKAEDLRKMAKSVPLEKLLLETDAPFLSPEGFRGKRNEPFQIKLLAEYIARIKGVTEEKVAEVTTVNAKGFFGFS